VSYQLPGHLWLPQRRGIEQTIELLEQGYDVCLYSPTGGGKTEQAIRLFEWAWTEHGWNGSFYVNRRLLIDQTAKRFEAAGLPYGIRAAEYEDQYDHTAPFQLCSADTEWSRVYVRKTWQKHFARLVVVDEAHLQKTGRMREILADHRSRGGRVVFLTATPIGLSAWADKLVVSGTLAEYRECRALVPAVVRTIQQPDMHKVKRNRTGEYVLDGRKRQVYTQAIVAKVIDSWKRWNPDGKATFLYGPCVASSRWLTQRFRDAGVNWAHVDATDAVVDGANARLTRSMWSEILERFEDGDIRGISCRFKCREGIDVPFAYHVILATPIGSLASYLQTVGRGLRYSLATPDHVLVTDHGGNYWRHGSPNHDRAWHDWWTLPEHAVSAAFQDGIRAGKTPEPIVCVMCSGERAGGSKCPHCGYESAKSVREVIQEDGTLVKREGRLIRERTVRRKKDTDELWKGMILRNHKYQKNRSFKQIYAWFRHEHGYYPPRDIPFMPSRPEDWCRKVWQVPIRELIQEPPPVERRLFEP